MKCGENWRNNYFIVNMFYYFIKHIDSFIFSYIIMIRKINHILSVELTTKRDVANTAPCRFSVCFSQKTCLFSEKNQPKGYRRRTLCNTPMGILTSTSKISLNRIV